MTQSEEIAENNERLAWLLVELRSPRRVRSIGAIRHDIEQLAGRAAPDDRSIPDLSAGELISEAAEHRENV